MKTVDYKTFAHHLCANDIEVFSGGSLIERISIFQFSDSSLSVNAVLSG
jgi:hypothetical protein